VVAKTKKSKEDDGFEQVLGQLATAFAPTLQLLNEQLALTIEDRKLDLKQKKTVAYPYKVRGTEPTQYRLAAAEKRLAAVRAQGAEKDLLIEEAKVLEECARHLAGNGKGDSAISGIFKRLDDIEESLTEIAGSKTTRARKNGSSTLFGRDLATDDPDDETQPDDQG
jgi:hypothetical protein